MIREVHGNLHADGIEMIDEAIIDNYPFPSEQFYFDWNNEMVRWGMKAVTMDVYLDMHQFRDHVMTHAEAAERLKNDIKIASRMGFENVRCLCLVPDLGIFQHSPTDLAISYYKRNLNPDMVDFILEQAKSGAETADILQLLNEKFPGHPMNFMNLSSLALNKSSADPVDIKEIVPYIDSIHGKFYHMTEIEGKPGQFRTSPSNIQSQSSI